MSLLPVGIGSEEGGYRIERSLRFNSADSAYLNRTPASAGNRTTWTWSGWVKRSAIVSGTTYGLFSCYVGSVSYTWCYLTSDLLDFGDNNSTGVFRRLTTQVFRDVSAWYHIVCVYDSGNATAGDRVRVYVNGVRVTSFSASTDPTLNAQSQLNQASQPHYIGAFNPAGNAFYQSGYLTEINFIDGQALTPSSFGEFNSDTGVWQPKKYTGTYGTNGFYLNFSDNSGTTSTTLGKDSSGNGNNWTPNNFSVTAGAGNDSLVDSPTRYGTDTGAGGEVRGNYATLNPLNSSSFSTLSDGNLRSFGNTATNSGLRASTFPATTGKIVWEQTATTVSGNFPELGCVSLIPNDGNGLNLAGSSTLGVQYRSNGVINKNNAVSVGTFSTISSGDVVRFELDVDALTCAIYKNNSLITTVTGLTAGVFYPAVVDYNGSVTNTNFGQRPFANTAPSGFKALVTTNLPEPTIEKGSQYFDATIYTGTGAAQSIVNSGSMQPDMVWIKSRSNVTFHQVVDVIRGVTKQLYPNDTAAETTATDRVTSLNSDGFSLGADATGGVNFNGYTYVAWNWKANGAGVSNTAGTITSTVSVNTTSGFSIVTYTGNNSTGTVGHGLGVAPRMIIQKPRNASGSWAVYHASLGAGNAVWLNLTDASSSYPTVWNSTAPTSSVYSVGSYMGTLTYVAYCFAPVAGYSAFGSYTGNGSADGPFVFTGFRPRYIMIKCSSATGNWTLDDSARSPYNVGTITVPFLYPNLNIAEANGGIDILSNGFKVRHTDSDYNANGATYIYAAFAENPFSIALAR